MVIGEVWKSRESVERSFCREILNKVVVGREGRFSVGIISEIEVYRSGTG